MTVTPPLVIPDVARRIAAQLESAQSVLICSHVCPDGDSIGSEVALGASLLALGKEVAVVKTDQLPLRYAFLHRPWVRENTPPNEQLVADVVVFLDVSEKSRVGAPLLQALPPRGNATWVSIDHHWGHTRFADLNWADNAASSVGEMVYHMLRLSGFPIPPIARDGLYVAMMTDTGRFAYANTAPSTLRAAADLLEAGADPDALSVQVYRSKSRGHVALEQRAYRTLQTSEEPHECEVAWISISREDFEETGTGPEDLGELVNVTVAMECVKAGLLFYELPDGAGTKVSFRGRRGFNVREIAVVFGGGGHRVAAGCTIQEPLETARENVLAEVMRRL